jgi:hypothetical protein
MEHDPTAIDPDEVKESQQEPTEDSGLQTPQPDQPIPTDQERFEKEQTGMQSTDPDPDKEAEPIEDESAPEGPSPYEPPPDAEPGD